MALLKDLYSPKFYKGISECIKECIPAFDEHKFLDLIYTPAFEFMELKARMKHTAEALHHFMPADYKQSILILEQLVESLKIHGFWQERLEMMFLPNYIEIYGLDDLDTSVRGMEVVTQYVSCEFAIRPFLVKYQKEMMPVLLSWSTHPQERVRRLSSEGCRPRLPWGISVPALKKDPGLIIPILENLRNDPSESVRRSVANNLNDISKDHPALLVELARKWKGTSKETDGIIKHACRTLLKQGHVDVLSDYGLDASGITLEDFEILTKAVKVGEALSFSFNITNTSDLAKTIRLEYAVYFRKANGRLTKKMFKISERIYQPGASVKVIRNQSFRLISTRKYYEGGHEISIVINGKELEKGLFHIGL
jgi:3-methyladenine DNA glycosylase AlkC